MYVCLVWINLSYQELELSLQALKTGPPVFYALTRTDAASVIKGVK